MHILSVDDAFIIDIVVLILFIRSMILFCSHFIFYTSNNFYQSLEKHKHSKRFNGA